MQLRVKLLPIVIGLGACMLALKSYDLGKGITVTGAVNVPTVQAQQAANAQTSATAAQPAKAQPASAQMAAPLPSKSMQQFASATPGGTQVAAEHSDSGSMVGPEKHGIASDPVKIKRSEFLADREDLSQSEINVLQALASRREELERREQAINQREALLEAAERRVDEKIAELGALQETIEGLLDTHSEQESAQLTNLVKIYENMKPKDAAQIFEQLDMPILLDVVERMKERRVAPILAEMDPQVAKDVTRELAERRQLPVPKE